ncbi:hypothetical protein [uncultured Bradyrhizobium sp.]|uniref:hypothetical protein n=1 Tax=uncultured Bradyrhizobium sp. TaxID=199684 RepID=UPI0035CA1ECF
MSDCAPPTENNHYEQACDQAIAMCGGNLRGAIKALIMANEYLETELQELRGRECPAQRAMPPDRSTASGAAPWPMSRIMSRCRS